MIAQVLLAPVGVFTVLGGNSFVSALVTLAISLSAILTAEDKREIGGSTDIIALACCGVFVGLYLSLCVYWHAWNRLETNFDSWPWNSDNLGSSVSSIPKCPFSGAAAEMKCPSCNALIHSCALHEENVLLKGFAIGEGPCLWKQAAEAIQRTDAPAIGRMMLDEALQVRCNFLLGGVGDACIGCSVWLRCFYALPRLASTLACLGLASALMPWGFKDLIHHLNMEPVHLCTAVYAVFCSFSALLVQLHAIGTALLFAHHYSRSIRFPIAMHWEHRRLRYTLIQLLAGPDWVFNLKEESILSTELMPVK